MATICLSGVRQRSFGPVKVFAMVKTHRKPFSRKAHAVFPAKHDQVLEQASARAEREIEHIVLCVRCP